jgi:hypothetical protein
LEWLDVPPVSPGLDHQDRGDANSVSFCEPTTNPTALEEVFDVRDLDVG